MAGLQLTPELDLKDLLLHLELRLLPAQRGQANSTHLRSDGNSDDGKRDLLSSNSTVA